MTSGQTWNLGLLRVEGLQGLVRETAQPEWRHRKMEPRDDTTRCACLATILDGHHLESQIPKGDRGSVEGQRVADAGELVRGT